MTTIKTVADRAKAASRRAELAGQQRAGAYSRRQIRIRRREVLREHWRHFGIILIIGLATALGAALLLPDEVSDFAVGAIAVITLWVSTSAMRWMDGMANHRLGVAGEEWTADELRKLRKHNWRVVNHVMLDKGGGDIDHAVLGPGGFFAVDSKYRTDWSTSTGSLDDLARRSRRQAAALQPRLGSKLAKVRPAVVLWGPGVSKVFDDVFEHEGVLFCVGRSFVEHVAGLETVVDQTEVDQAFAKLDEYVANRDIGEARDHGDRARPIVDHVQDLVIAMSLAAATFLAITTAIKIPPIGLWSVVLAVAIAVASRSVRRRLSENERIQRATAAVSATSIGFGTVLAAFLVIDVIW